MLVRRQSEIYRNSFIGEEVGVLWEDTEVIKGRTYMIGHTDRYVRVAKEIEDTGKEAELSGQITLETVTGFINSDTLLI